MTSRSDSAAPVGPAAPPDHPYTAEIDLERVLWYEITGICRSLSPEERLEPGYYRDPDWSVKDLVAHLGAWLAVAENQIEQIGAGTYEHREVDVDARNAEALATLRAQDWETIWTQAHAARAWMYRSWLTLTERSDRGRLLGPQGRRRALRRARRSPPRVGRRARHATDALRLASLSFGSCPLRSGRRRT